MVMPKRPHIGSASECPCKFNCETYTFASKYIIVVFSSYTTLLMLTYGDRMEKTWEAHRKAEWEGLSFWEAKRVVEMELFLGRVPSLEHGVPTPICYSTRNVLACCILREERGRTYVPLGSPRQHEGTQF